MIDEIIWTSGAHQDFQAVYSFLEDLRIGSGDALVSSVDHLLELLKIFPEQAVVYRGEIRRLLVGKGKHYGLFYALEGGRIVIIALADLRKNPRELERVLRERGVD